MSRVTLVDWSVDWFLCHFFRKEDAVKDKDENSIEDEFLDALSSHLMIFYNNKLLALSYHRWRNGLLRLSLD
jgi:hypothetical protein